MNDIKSPYSDVIVFEEKLKNLVDQEELDQCFVFYLPQVGDGHTLDTGMCGHELLQLSEDLKELAEERLKRDPHDEA